MFLLVALLLSLVFLGTLWYSRVVKKRELFHPIHLVSLFHFIFNVPFIFFLAIDRERYFPSFFVAKIKDISLETMIGNYAWVQILFFACLIVGIRLNFLKPLRFLGQLLPHISSRNHLVLYIGMLLSFTFGLLSFYWFMAVNGGLMNVLLNLHLRTTFTNGNGYLLNGLGLIQISLFFFIYARKGKTFRWSDKLILLFLSLFLIVLFSTLGGRKTALFIVLYIVFLLHYFVQPIRLRFGRLFLMGSLLAFYIILIPILRSKGGVATITKDSGALVTQMLDRGADVLIGHLSYVPQYTFIINYFNRDNAWYGSSYRDILTAPMPRSWYPAKPPVDDGVYISHIINRDYVKPPVRFDKLYPVSYPGETLGMSYANFLLPGVIFFGLLLGAVYQLTYTIMLYSKGSFIPTYLYIITIMNFQFSNLRIVNFLSILLFNGLFILLVFGLAKLLRGK